MKLGVVIRFWMLLAQEIEIRTRCAGIDLSTVKPTRLPGQKQERARQREAFERSQPWRAMRKRVLDSHPAECKQCGSGERLQVDHIKPKSRFPELALEYSNLQVLCWPCNKAKAAR